MMKPEDEGSGEAKLPESSVTYSTVHSNVPDIPSQESTEADGIALPDEPEDEPEHFRIVQDSRIGPRQENQDRLLAAASDDILVIGVADGMGGGERGGEAADVAVECVLESFHSAMALSPGDFDVAADSLRSAFPKALVAVSDISAVYSIPMGHIGTTLTGIVVDARRGKLAVCHVGDTRAYLWTAQAGLRRITQDHAINGLLERAISNDVRIPAEPDDEIIELSERCTILLIVSDGFWQAVPERLLERYMKDITQGQTSLDTAMASLMQHGESVAQDNLTVVAALIGELPDIQEPGKKHKGGLRFFWNLWPSRESAH